MPEVLAAIRPDDQSFALLLHLVGATVVFGALLASATSLALARGDTRLLRLGYFSLLLVGLPGLILLRLAGEWLYQLQNWDELPAQIDEPAWLGIGFLVADWGGSSSSCRSRSAASASTGWATARADAGLLKVTMVISLVLIVAYVVAVWAMTGKPN